MEMRFTYRFEAAHRFIGSSSPKCMTPHGHTWWIHLQISGQSSKLNSNQMMAEFASLKGPWKAFVDNSLDHTFFHHKDDPVAQSCSEHISGFRGLSFPGDPTTELIAILCFSKANKIIEMYNSNNEAQFQVEKIEIQETPTNAIVLARGDSIIDETLSSVCDSHEAWWNQSDPQLRS